jgi:hypothetical protein
VQGFTHEEEAASLKDEEGLSLEKPEPEDMVHVFDF